jgi:uncharacterized membrane protein
MSLVSILNFAVSCILAQLIYKYISKPYDATAHKASNVARFCSTLICIVVGAYVTRQIVEKIPVSALSIALFDPTKVKESKGSVVTAFAYFMYLADHLKSYKPILQIV